MITTLVRPTTVISQESLSKIVHLRRQVKELEDWLVQEKAKLLASEEQVISALEDNIPIETGERAAQVKIASRRIVAWKEAFIARLGKAMADRVQAEVEPVVYKRLEIA